MFVFACFSSLEVMKEKPLSSGVHWYPSALAWEAAINEIFVWAAALEKAAHLQNSKDKAERCWRVHDSENAVEWDL